MLAALGGRSKALVVDAKGNENLSRSTRNLARRQFLPPEGLNVYDLLRHDTLVLTKDAAKAVIERAASRRQRKPAMRSAQSIIKRPLLTEKSARLQETGGGTSAGGEEYSQKVVFEVARDANKIEIRHAVEALFNVEVTDVRTLIVRGKVKRIGRFVGKRPNWKKAIVTLQAGDNIEFFEGV